MLAEFFVICYGRRQRLRAMARNPRSTRWHDVDWPEGTDFRESARRPASLQEEWDVYEAASGAQRRCTASPALAKTRGNLLQFRFSAIVYALYLRRKEDGVTIDKVESV